MRDDLLSGSEKSEASNAHEYSVGEISNALKRTVEDRFGHVRVRGEISGYRGPHSSGHSYFSLKDEKARLEAVIWRGARSKLKHQPEEGMEVIATGKLTTYPGSSKYQIVIDGLEPAGAGALMAMLEERRKKLAAEGLFDENRKQLLPFMPNVIGVITSPTGAVIRDVMHRLNDRFPVHVIVWPVRVQGETSGAEVANGIRQFNALPDDGPLPKPELLIVARGGGSLEDLWGFNDEAVVRAAADSFIPIISAVGHETDWTLIDHAADRRAPTPTAAAEKAVPVRAELEARVAELSARLKKAQSRILETRRNQLSALSKGVVSADMLLALPRRRLDEASGRLLRGLDVSNQQARLRYTRFAERLSPDGLLRHIGRARERLVVAESAQGRALLAATRTKRSRFDAGARTLRPEGLLRRVAEHRQTLSARGHLLASSQDQIVERLKARHERADRLLQTLSYKGVLSRGYAVVFDGSGKPVRNAASLSERETVAIEFSDGRRSATISDGSEVPTPKPTRKKQTGKPAKADPDDQGSLF